MNSRLGSATLGTYDPTYYTDREEAQLVLAGGAHPALLESFALTELRVQSLGAGPAFPHSNPRGCPALVASFATGRGILISMSLGCQVKFPALSLQRTQG